MDWVPNGAPTLSDLANRFIEVCDSRAAIVGPHGSGKTTLLHHLIPRIGPLRWHQPAAGQALSGSSQGDVIWLQLRKPNAWSVLWKSRQYWRTGATLVLDGYEQLSLVQRGWTLWLTRRRKMGLLVTSHQTTWLPTLLATRMTGELAQTIVRRLLKAEPDTSPRILRQLTDAEWLERQLQRHGGNLREVLMDCYDVIEADAQSGCDHRGAPV